MEQLVKEVLEGKVGAATRFYRAYEQKIRRYLWGRLGQEQDVEDILQDVFLSAFDSLPLYRGEASVNTWILSIARHEVADFYRKRYVRAVVEKTAPLFEEMVTELETPEFALKKKNLRGKFLKVYRGLSKQHQDVLSLRFEMGMSVKEIAARMKLPFKATESLLYRARQAFATAYETQE
jgi:RNA polymerase sigma-70 factor (ECF subfamily)